MNSIAFPRELFEIRAVNSLRPQLLFVDRVASPEGNRVQVENWHEETDAKKILTIVRQIANIAHNEYGWNQRDLDNLLKSYEIDPDFNPQDEIGIVLVFSYMCYLQARLAEKTSQPSYWQGLSPDDRQQLFAYASDVFEVLPDYHNYDELSEPLRADGDRTSQKFGIDFGKLISGLNINQNKFVENALRAKTNVRQLETAARESNLPGRLRELTPAEMEERGKKSERALERQRHRLASMSAEELALADYGFKVLDESLRAARGISNWE
jgi:hypothetical protein